MVQGTEVDYATEGLNSTIKFNNPNAQDLCGCGESFSV
jgi:Fe-S cluster assembly iron-binding protein IscA